MWADEKDFRKKKLKLLYTSNKKCGSAFLK